MDIDTLRRAVRGTVLAADDPAWANALDGLLWNARKPDRAPAVILRAACIEDVRRGVRFAAACGLPVSPRGGGHNWSGIAQQPGLSIDLSGLDTVRVDAQARIAEAGPGATNRMLAAALARHGLAFPVGHCASVPLSGYLLGGGIGWKAGAWGVACFSVESVDVVTPDGSLVRASERENPELFWLARGAGPLFPGIAVGFRLRLQALPRAIRTAVRIYPLAAHGEVAAWMARAMADVPETVEFTVKMTPDPALCLGIATVFADDTARADAILDRIAALAPAGAIDAPPASDTPLDVLYDIIDASFPRPRRVAADALWSDAAPEELFGALARGVAAAPSRESFALGVVRSPLAPPPGNGAFSMIGGVFGAAYALWQDPAEDAAQRAWVRGIADDAGSAVKGAYIGEADLDRPGRLTLAFGPGVPERIDALRARFDPDGRFRRTLSGAPLPAAA